MKRLFLTLLAMAAMAFAENVQVLEPSGAEFSTDAPQVVMSILRSAVAQTGNTPVESSADIQLRTTLSTMGSSIVVVVEQIKDGAVEEQDLHEDVKDRMTVTHDSSTGGLRLGGYAKPGSVPADNVQDVGQGGGEDTDDEETGFETGVDDGEGDI